MIERRDTQEDDNRLTPAQWLEFSYEAVAKAVLPSVRKSIERTALARFDHPPISIEDLLHTAMVRVLEAKRFHRPMHRDELEKILSGCVRHICHEIDRKRRFRNTALRGMQRRLGMPEN